LIFWAFRPPAGKPNFYDRMSNMYYLATLHDKDIFPQPTHITPDHYEKRVTVKALVKNEGGEFGFITNPIHKCYLLAGGGAESADIIQEIKRECIEEIRYEVDVEREVGRIHEFRDRDAKEYETICFLVEAKKETYGDLRTEDEKKNDLSVIWLEGETARKILREQVDKVRKGEIKFYNTAFNIVRDQIFFEEIFKDRND